MSSEPTDLLRLINPSERQSEFLRTIAEKRFVLYGGAAGGGKSYILRWWLVAYLIQLFRYRGLRNVRVGLFSEDYPTLYDRQISKIMFEFPKELGELKQSPVKDFVLRPELGGGVISLRNLDDPSKYQSAEFAAIGVDELTKNSKDVFDFLRMRLRWTGIERPRFAGATNPGGIGHAWVKKLWKNRDFPPELEPIKHEFAFVQAKASDNPHLPVDYYKSLLTLPPDMARKFAEGDWDVYTGQYFPHFSQSKHVITKAEVNRRIQPWHERGAGGDWGFGHPHCFHWHAKDEHGHITTYRESWGRMEHEIEVGKKFTRLNGNDKLSGFAFSWDDGKLSARSERMQPKSIGKLFREGLGPNIPEPHPCDSSPGIRIIRARLMSQLLESGMWHISEECPKLIEAIPLMLREEDDYEQMAKIDFSDSVIGDDPVDSAAVGLQWMVRQSIKPRDVIMEEKLMSVRSTFAGKVTSPETPDEMVNRLGGRMV